MNRELSFYRGKKVFLTGHTGFKGAWLALWLNRLGAKVTGYALKAPTRPSLYGICRVDRMLKPVEGDVRDAATLGRVLRRVDPDIVFHLAAQPLVRDSYRDPVGTFAVNVMGTANILEACRKSAHPAAVVIITTDKCYAQDGRQRIFRENDPLGGNDPYSASKGCAEIVTAAYRRSFFDGPAGKYPAVATARAGNVIGGGDWARERLIPDCVRAFMRRENVSIRYPQAVRPWQHVFEALYGYLLLGRALTREPKQFSGAWNFGPLSTDAWPVGKVADLMADLWGKEVNWTQLKGPKWHEEPYLKLDSTKARRVLGWKPHWDVRCALSKTLLWYKAYAAKVDMAEYSQDQLSEYETGELATCSLTGKARHESL